MLRQTTASTPVRIVGKCYQSASKLVTIPIDAQKSGPSDPSQVQRPECDGQAQYGRTRVVRPSVHYHQGTPPVQGYHVFDVGESRPRSLCAHRSLELVRRTGGTP